MTSTNKLPQAVLIYDGDCGFCSTSARWVDTHIKSRANIKPWQWMNLEALNLNRARVIHEVVWIDPTGRTFGGAQAVAKLLISAGGFWAILGRVLRVPPFRWVGHWLYRLIALNRQRLPGGTPTCSLQK